MKHTIKTSLTIAALTAAAILGRSAPVNAAPMDQGFVIKAGHAGMAEVAMAKLALQKSRNPVVDSFAERMIHDHTMLNNRLTMIVGMQHLTPPMGVGAANAAMMTSLTDLSDTAFDSAYLRGQMPAHIKTLQLLQQYAASGTDPQLVAFAKGGIPIVKMHIAMLRRDLMMMHRSSM